MSNDHTTISEKTKIPLKNVFTIAGVSIALSASWYDLKSSQSEALREIRGVQNETLREIREVKKSSWTQPEMAEWTFGMQLANPTIKVPIVSAKINETAGANRE